MSCLRLIELTYAEVEALDRARTVAIVPVGAIEAHGPHLPLGTDGIIAEAMSEAAVEPLAADGLDVLLLPTLLYTPAPFAGGFTGTVSIAAATLVDHLTGVAARLAAWGFPVLALANAHLDPTHLGALHDAAQRIGSAGAPRLAFPDLTRKPWAARLTEEFRSGACHAGQYEGSIVLAARPDLVRQAIMSALPPHPVSLSRAIREGKQRFEEAGGEHAYFGAPAAATAAEGRATLAVLGEILAESIRQAR